MSIQKFFRQYSRTLLMVFMALLLVTFLIPSTIEGCGERERTARMRWGEAYGAAVTERDRTQASAELGWLMRMGLPPPTGRAEERDRALQYHLMNLEAHHAGLRVGREEALGFLQSIQMPAESLQFVQQRSHMSYDQIYDMVGRWLAVMRLAALQQTALFESLPRRQMQYRDRMQEAAVQIAALDSRAFVERVPEPTEEQLSEFFEATKDRPTAHTQDELVFGYRLPKRVQLEILTVNPEALKPRLSTRELNQYFEDHRQRYTRPDPSASQPADGSPPPQVPMTFEEARERVREDARRDKAAQEAQRIVNEMYNDARQPWIASTIDDDGFAVPPTTESIAFTALRDRYTAQAPIEYQMTTLLDQKGLQALPGFGQAGLGASAAGQTRLPAPTLALRVKGLLEKDPNDRQPVLTLMEPAPVVLTQRPDPQTRQMHPHQAFLFRVVQLAPEAPPAALDEVRTQVVKDWKLQQAHELAGQYAERLAARAREVGLPAAVAEATELRDILSAAEQAATQPEGSAMSAPPYVKNLGPIAPERFTRQSTFIRQVGSVGPKVAEAIFALAAEPAPTSAPSTAEAPATTSAPAHRAALINQADKFRWLVGELIELKPLYAVGFEDELTRDAPSGSPEVRRFQEAWLDPRNVEQRTGFRSAVEAAPRDERGSEQP